MEATELELLITDLSRAGAGVARDEEGRVVFVPNTAPGDRVRARVVAAEKRYAQGELVEVLEPSPLRAVPRCPAFGRCGGCKWQHIPYELQWKTKAEGVKHALKRVGFEAPAAWDELPADEAWEYRNRVQLRGEGGHMGFYAAGSHELVAVERCDIARPEINAVWEETRREGARRPRPYKVEIEVLEDGTVRKAWNSGHAAQGFRQIHDAQNAKLRTWVGGALTSGRPLFDLFGGDGNLSRPLVGQMSEVHCVDVSAPSERAPASRGPVFHRAAVLPWLVRRRPDGRRWSAVVDPPREGLGPDGPALIAEAERLGVDEWVAVGCDADAWARDLSRLARRGWRLERAAALDFFPQTPHVEALALLRRNS